MGGLEELSLVPDPIDSLSCIFICPLNHSVNYLFNKIVLNLFYVPSTVLGTGDIAVSEEAKSLLWRRSVPVWETDNKIK